MKSEQKPQLSVVVPVHLMAGKLQNLEKVLKESQRLNLAIQYLLIQDGVDQETANQLQGLAQKYSAEYHQVDFLSPGLTRNFGLELTRALWVTFWDSDDLGEPQHVLSAIAKAQRRTKVLVGGYKIHDVISGLITETIKPDRSLERLMINPGCWRFVFKKEYIGEVRFPSSRMGEDQVFLARLNIQDCDLEYIDDSFYTYSIGSNSQLTKDKESVLEIQKSILLVRRIILSEKRFEDYLYILNARMALTAYKWKGVSKIEFIKYLVGGKELNWRKRRSWIFAFSRVSKLLVLNSRIEKT